MIRLICLLFLIFFILKNLFAINNSSDISYINTKNISYNHVDQVIFLGEDSLINLNNSTIKLNTGIIDYKNNKISIEDIFYFYLDSNILSGIKLEGNLDLTQFTANKISYIYNNDLKIDSNKVSRNQNEIFFYDNFLSPCEINGFFKCPTWSLKINKTKYLVNEDKFVHYDSFLQIADKKILYLPYLSHYGIRAPKKMGFLTPSLEINLIGSKTLFKTPFYIPIGSTGNFTITPIIKYNDSFNNYFDTYEIKSEVEQKFSNGLLLLDLNTQKTNRETSLLNTLRIKSFQTISPKSNVEFNALFTNNISNARSTNLEQIPLQASYLRLNKYDLTSKNDYLITEINTTTPFDNSDLGLIPNQIPFVIYKNKIDLENKASIYNDINFFNIERNKSDDLNPKKEVGFTLQIKIFKLIRSNNTNFFNKFIINNSYKNLSYLHNSNLNKEVRNNEFSISSEIIKNITSNVKTKVKFIINESIDTIKVAKEPSAITINYINLFEENRFFGFDQNDNSSRVAFGIEYSKYFNQNKFEFSVGQSYDTKKNNNFLKTINQNSHFSDYIFLTSLKYQNINFNIDSRIDQKKLSKKEMNYNLRFGSPIEFLFGYNETRNDAFLYNTDDTKLLKLGISSNINENMSLAFDTNLDLNDKYNPYKSKLNLNIFDECSNLEIAYINSKFTDNDNTNPKELISLTYRMEYLGFLGFENQTNLFYKNDNAKNNK